MRKILPARGKLRVFKTSTKMQLLRISNFFFGNKTNSPVNNWTAFWLFFIWPFSLSIFQLHMFCSLRRRFPLLVVTVKNSSKKNEFQYFCSTTSRMNKPFKLIKVVEIAGLAPVPFCGLILSDFGAHVTLVQVVWIFNIKKHRINC